MQRTKQPEKKVQYEKVPVEEQDSSGKMVFNIGADLASADPFVYGRLIKAGKLKEARKMAHIPMYRLKKK